MKQFKVLVALVLALVMVLAVASVAFATAQNVSPFTTAATDNVNVTVTGLMEGDTLYLYKVGAPEVDEFNQMTITWTPTSVGTLVENATTENWSYSPSATLQTGIAALIGTGADQIDVTASTSFMATVASGATSATVAVEPGYYLGLVRQGTASANANRIYQNMLINAIPEPNAGVWQKHADVTATVKYTEETITKQQKENGSSDWTAETVDGYKRGDFIPFKVTTVIPSYPLNSLYATFQITDTATGLKFVNDTAHPLTLKVNTSDVTTDATTTVNTSADDETFVITVGDTALSVVFDKEYILTHPGQAVELTYWAELIADVNTSNNKAAITYNRNPDEDTTQDDDDTVDQLTYGFTLLKYEDGDSSKNPLVGASFTLWDATTAGNQIQVIYDSAIEIKTAEGTTKTVAGYRPIKAGETPAKYIEATDGTASVYCLSDATYYVQEDIAPAGYTRMSGRMAITPSATTSIEGIDLEIPNTAGVTLPTTGGIGTTIFYVSGLLLVLGAATILVARRKADAE